MVPPQLGRQTRENPLKRTTWTIICIPDLKMAAKFPNCKICFVLLQFLVLVLLTEGGNVELTNWEGKTYDQMHEPTLKPYSLPILPYEGGYRGLEPVIDERTLKVHHTGHHKTYTDNMNSLLSSWRGSVSMK